MDIMHQFFNFHDKTIFDNKKKMLKTLNFRVLLIIIFTAISGYTERRKKLWNEGAGGSWKLIIPYLGQYMGKYNRAGATTSLRQYQ